MNILKRALEWLETIKGPRMSPARPAVYIDALDKRTKKQKDAPKSVPVKNYKVKVRVL